MAPILGNTVRRRIHVMTTVVYMWHQYFATQAIISDMSLVAGLPWSFSIIAASDCEVLAISRDQFLVLLEVRDV